MAELDPTGGEVTVGGLTLRTPGLSGVANELPASLDGLRGPAEDGDELLRVLADEEMTPQEVVEIQEANEEPVDFSATRTAHGEAAIEVDAPAPTAGYEQVVLYTDEAGVTSWHFAGGFSGEGQIRGADGTRTYTLARRVPDIAGQGGSRNLAGAIGRKIIRVLTFPIAGWAADKIVDHWEGQNRPYRLRSFTESDKGANGTTLTADALRQFAGKRSLLLIHGTGSTTSGGFGNMRPDLLAALTQRYEGRVFAFDHPTIASAPAANVRELLTRLSGPDWDLDVITHSRGGLVARTLVERAGDFADLAPERLRIRRAVFLGVPNDGTPLADMTRMQAYVDTYTTLLNLVAVGLPVAATLAGIIAIVKQLAAGAISGLDGLQSMVPEGSFLSGLPGGNPATQYFAMASNYEPGDPGLASFKDAVLDDIFDAPNDLVVPTLGVYDLGEARGSFPVGTPHEFVGTDGVDHSSFVRNQAAVAPILNWLQ